MKFQINKTKLWFLYEVLEFANILQMLYMMQSTITTCSFI